MNERSSLFVAQAAAIQNVKKKWGDDEVRKGNNEDGKLGFLLFFSSTMIDMQILISNINIWYDTTMIQEYKAERLTIYS